MPDTELYSILSKYGRLKIETSDDEHYLITLYGSDDDIFSSGYGSYRGALIEVYDVLRHYLMLKTRSTPEFE